MSSSIGCAKIFMSFFILFYLRRPLRSSVEKMLSKIWNAVKRPFIDSAPHRDDAPSSSRNGRLDSSSVRVSINADGSFNFLFPSTPRTSSAAEVVRLLTKYCLEYQQNVAAAHSVPVQAAQSLIWSALGTLKGVR